jgi:hypothetical protein
MVLDDERRYHTAEAQDSGKDAECAKGSLKQIALTSCGVNAPHFAQDDIVGKTR